MACQVPPPCMAVTIVSLSADSPLAETLEASIIGVNSDYTQSGRLTEMPDKSGHWTTSPITPFTRT